MTAPGHETDFTYRGLAVWSEMTFEQLTLDWESVPTEDQAFLAREYERQLRAAGVADDAAEAQLIRAMLGRYRDQGLVPVGPDVWVEVPPTVREAFAEDDAIPEEVLDDDHEKSGIPRWAVAVGGLVVLVLLGWLLQAAFTADDTPPVAAVAATASVTPTVSPTPTVTASPTTPPTPTPIALNAVDDSITRGQVDDDDYFPTLLRVAPDDGTSPRLFVVQGQIVQVAEWRYDPNPDIAAWLTGRLVRPVFGLPYSPENAALVERLESGGSLLVTTNTGNTLSFIVQEVTTVARADTSVLRQHTPGAVLVLLDQRNLDGEPIDTRTVVLADYDPRQSNRRIDRSTQLHELGTPIPLPGEAVLTLTSASLDQSSANLPENTALAVVTLDVQTGSDPLDLRSVTWTLGNVGPTAARGATPCAAPDDMPPETTDCVSLAFVIASEATNDRLNLTLTDGTRLHWRVTYPDPSPVSPHAALDVAVRDLVHTAETLTFRVRVYNPLDYAIPVAPEDIWITLGYTPAPRGPRQAPPAFIGYILEPDEAADFDFAFTTVRIPMPVWAC